MNAPGASVIETAQLVPADWPSVRRIYFEGIGTGMATFETKPPTWQAWDRGHLATPRLVARSGGGVVGWAALAPVSDRCAYAGVAEDSVYVDATMRGRGVGELLLRTLLAESETAGIWTVQTGIFPDNLASLALHERCGFRRVGTRERVGRLDGRWRDVVFLERRSTVAGVD
jgi:L-amino acid N-acyltransferase YncA